MGFSNKQIQQIIESVEIVEVYYNRFEAFFYSNFKITAKEYNINAAISIHSHYLNATQGSFIRIKEFKEEFKKQLYKALELLEQYKKWLETEEEKRIIINTKQRISNVSSKYEYIKNLLETFEIREK